MKQESKVGHFIGPDLMLTIFHVWHITIFTLWLRLFLVCTRYIQV